MQRVGPPPFVEFLLKIDQKVSLGGLREHALPFLYSQVDSLFSSHAIKINKPRIDSHKRPPAPSMTVHRNLAPPLQDTPGKYIHDFHHLFESRRSHILPVLVLEAYVPAEE